MTKLTETQTNILTSGAQRPDNTAMPLPKGPAGAAASPQAGCDRANLIVALALGALGIHCGTAFLATREFFAHDDHKSRVIVAKAEDTV